MGNHIDFYHRRLAAIYIFLIEIPCLQIINKRDKLFGIL